ncbi:MAG: ATP-binding domain-containing protein, partial [Clostridia bacterium]|nr:ATP-binding domain-containing protein [Clostridia bacterium]
VLPFSNVVRCIEGANDKGAKPYELTCYIVKLIALKEYYSEDNEENKSRKENIRELLHAIEQFQKNNPETTLQDYLQQVSLYSDLDEMNDADDCVTLATVHSAKGLEFKVVFVVGLEEGVFPDCRCDDDASELEEERRLMYVAITRAKEKLFLSCAKQRFKFGQIQICLPSRFLREGGFIKERPIKEESSYGGYGYLSYRGERNYSSGGGAYNGEELPLDNGPSVKVADNKKKVNPADYKVGTRVRHAKFGLGTIVELETRGDL